MSRTSFLMTLLLISAAPLAGCFGPNYAKIDNELRAKNNHLQQQLDEAAQRERNLQATNTLLTQELDAKTPRLATLPQERLDQLFTVNRIALQKSTDASDMHNTGTPDSFRVFLRMFAADGSVLPATGDLTIEAFDLALGGDNQRVGKWTFTPEQLKKNWYPQLGLNHFALDCPWTTPPQHQEITFKIHFVDALTNRAFEDQQLIRLHTPVTSAPAASQAGQ